jgi:hypothetical protein
MMLNRAGHPLIPLEEAIEHRSDSHLEPLALPACIIWAETCLPWSAALRNTTKGVDLDD